jgi:hypothetical protein
MTASLGLFRAGDRKQESGMFTKQKVFSYKLDTATESYMLT